MNKLRPSRIILFMYVNFFLCVFFIACNKETEETYNTYSSGVTYPDPGISTIQSQNHPGARVTYPFHFEATGPFTISPVSATVVKIEQEMLFTSASPFPLINGWVRGFDDLTIPTFPDRFFNGSFRFAGQGNDSLFATVTVQTSIFSDPINPGAGDFFGSEDFTGTCQITGGTGRYLNATGSGEYAAHSEWRPPTRPGTFFSGSTSVNGTGTISVLARNGHIESMIH